MFAGFPARLSERLTNPMGFDPRFDFSAKIIENIHFANYRENGIFFFTSVTPSSPK